MSNELRTPLSAVIGFSSLIDQEIPMDQIILYVQMIHNSGSKLLEIIEGILDLTLLEGDESKTHLEWFSLAPFMKTLFENAKEEQQKANKPQLEIECINCNFEEQIQLFSDQKNYQNIYPPVL